MSGTIRSDDPAATFTSTSGGFVAKSFAGIAIAIQ